MRTDELIRSLASDVPPVARGAARHRLATGIVAGCVVTFAIVALALGFRPDFATALHGFSFWMKAGYTLFVTIVAIVVVARLGRPGVSMGRAPWLLTVPVGCLR